jgi:hypothetical protein
MLYGSYKGMAYSITRIDAILGAYYEIQILVGKKVYKQHELNLIRAMDILASELKSRLIKEEILLISLERVQRLIIIWDQFNRTIADIEWLNSSLSQSVMKEMFFILLELRNAGYSVTDEGQWYHHSEDN